MSKILKINLKLTTYMSILIVIFALLTITSTNTYYTKYKNLENLDTGIVLSIKVSKLLNEIQNERYLSNLYLFKRNTKNKNNLNTQIVKSKIISEELSKFIDILELNNTNNQIMNKLYDALDKLDVLNKVRLKIRKNIISNSRITLFYNILNDNLLDVINEISKISHIPSITQNIIAYNNFLIAKEYVSREIILSTNIINNKHIISSPILEINTIFEKGNLYMENFFKYATLDFSYYYLVNIDIFLDNQIKENHNNIIKNGLRSLTNEATKNWYKQLKIKTHNLSIVEKQLSKEIKQNIEDKIVLHNQRIFIFVVLNLLSSIIFMMVLIFIIRLILNEKRLKNKVDKYIISSTTDTKGIITDASVAFCEISGYSIDELVGQPHNIVRHPDMKKDVFKSLWKTIKSGKTWEGKILNKRKDNANYWVEATVEPIKNSENIIIGYISVRHDITANILFEQQQKKLMEQEKLASMGEMIGNIAHQWRQPLSMISTAATGMQVQKEYGKLTDEIFNKSCDDIDKNAQYLSKTIDDFRNFIKGDNTKNIFNIKKCVNSLLQLIDGSLKHNDINIIESIDDKIEINGYENELIQCMMNILNNSKDAFVEQNIENRYIFISSVVENDKLRISIKDNAGGIPDDIIMKIFEPYFTTKHQSKGTGLGLNMVRNLILDGMNGSIDVVNVEYEYNNIQYKGAKFNILLPIN